jgi:hypothetical protein
MRAENARGLGLALPSVQYGVETVEGKEVRLACACSGGWSSSSSRHVPHTLMLEDLGDAAAMCGEAEPYRGEAVPMAVRSPSPCGCRLRYA